MSDLLQRLDNLACDGEWCSPLAHEAAARVRELEADAVVLVAGIKAEQDHLTRTMQRAERAEAERDALRRENEALRALLVHIDAHYSGSLDHQPAYVRLVRAALAQGEKL